jgi:glycosyltransferase involved in cell wall biosynthesis
MSVFNCEKYLKDSINSILNQSYSNFEFIIINDASTDSSRAIILSFSDSRIVYLENENNIGLTNSLNKAISVAKGDFIARMDADDWSYPNRLEIQVEYLKDNTQVAYVGSNGYFFIDHTNEEKYVNLSLNNEYLFTELFFNNYFIHTSILFRKSIFNEFNYNNKIKFAQDYYLWSQILKKYSAANIDLPLVRYRIHNKSISIEKKELQDQFVKETYKLHLSYLGLDKHHFTKLNLHYDLFHNKIDKSLVDPQKVSDYLSWILLLKKQNDKLKIYNTSYFNFKLLSFWKKYFPILVKSKFKLIHLLIVFNSFNNSISFFRKNKIILRLMLNSFTNKIYA